MGSWQTWLHGLAAAFIGAFANGVVLTVVDPVTFNFTGGGGHHLLTVCLVSGIFSAAAYLKQSPLPKDQ